MVLLDVEFAKVIELVLLDHWVNGVLVVAVALIESEPESVHTFVPDGFVVPLPEGDTTKET